MDKIKAFFKGIWEANKSIIIAGLKSAAKQLVLNFAIPPMEKFVAKTENKFDDQLVAGFKAYVNALFEDPSLLAANSPVEKKEVAALTAEEAGPQSQEEATV